MVHPYWCYWEEEKCPAMGTWDLCGNSCPPGAGFAAAFASCCRAANDLSSSSILLASSLPSPPTLCPPPAHPLPSSSPSISLCLALPCAPSHLACTVGDTMRKACSCLTAQPTPPTRGNELRRVCLSAVPGAIPLLSRARVPLRPSSHPHGENAAFPSWLAEKHLTVRDAVNYMQIRTVQALLKPAGRVNYPLPGSECLRCAAMLQEFNPQLVLLGAASRA